MLMKPEVRAFFDEATFTVTYVVSDPATKRAAVIDPVREFDPSSGRTSTASADAVVADVRERGLCVDWILETHVHADHLSAAPHVKEELGGSVAIDGVSNQTPGLLNVFSGGRGCTPRLLGHGTVGIQAAQSTG